MTLDASALLAILCLAYGTAAAANDTLLFVGHGFAQTDIPPA